jgi:hypothetical protein
MCAGAASGTHHVRWAISEIAELWAIGRVVVRDKPVAVVDELCTDREVRKVLVMCVIDVFLHDCGSCTESGLAD